MVAFVCGDAKYPEHSILEMKLKFCICSTFPYPAFSYCGRKKMRAYKCEQSSSPGTYKNKIKFFSLISIQLTGKPKTIFMVLLAMFRERRGEIYGFSTWNYRPLYDLMNNTKKKFI